MEKLDFVRVSGIVKGERTAIIKAYSNKSFSKEIGCLGLMEFLASQYIVGM